MSRKFGERRIDKGKPVARRGRKVTGPSGSAGLPKGVFHGCSGGFAALLLVGVAALTLPRRRGRQAGGRPGAHRDRLGRAQRRLLPHRRARRRRRPARVGEGPAARAEGRQPAHHGADVQEPQLDDGRRVRQRRHRHLHPGGRGPPRVVPAEHERQALHLQRLRLPVGGRHRQPRLPGPLGRQRGRQAEGGPVGRRLRRRHQPDDGVPLQPVGAVAKYPTDAAYSAATGSALAAHRPAVARAGQARGRQLRLLARSSAAPSRPGSSTSPAAWRSTSRSTANRRARATSPAPTGTTCSASSRRPRPPGSCSSASRTRTAPTAPRPATAGRRCCSPRTALPRSRCTRTTPARPGSPSTATTSARPAARRPSWPAESTGARSSAASCSSTRPRRAWPCGSAVATAAPACAPRARTVMRPHTGLVLLAVNPKRSREASSKPHRRRVARRSVRVRVACHVTAARAGGRSPSRSAAQGRRARGRSPPRRKLHRTARVRVRIERQGPCGAQARTPPQDRRPRAPLSSRYSPS